VEIAPTPNVQLWDPVTGGGVQLSGTAEPKEIRFFSKRFEALVVVYASALSVLPPAAPPTSPAAPARGMIRRVVYTAALFSFFLQTRLTTNESA
jgi:hypothetical protein